MLKRYWKNIVVFVLGLALIFGLFAAQLVVAWMCSSGTNWPICFMQ